MYVCRVVARVSSRGEAVEYKFKSQRGFPCRCGLPGNCRIKASLEDACIYYSVEEHE